jgi:ArsR family transcriptional regulator
MKRLATQFKGISDPIRLRILNLLAHGELCVCDLIAVLNLPQSTISRHLGCLRKHSWVMARRSGKWMHYQRPPQPPPFQADFFSLLDKECITDDQARADSCALAARLADGGSSCGRDCS